MKLRYPAIFHREDNSYWIEFPDLDGCFSNGESINEAMDNAEEALSAYVMLLLESNEDLPAPSDIANITVEDGFVSLVSCVISSY